LDKASGNFRNLKLWHLALYQVISLSDALAHGLDPQLRQ
jgi:hypothetical protein